MTLLWRAPEDEQHMATIPGKMTQHDLMGAAIHEGLRVKVATKGLPVPHPKRWAIIREDEHGCEYLYIIEQEIVDKRKARSEERKKPFQVSVKGWPKKGPLRELTWRGKAGSYAAAVWQAVREFRKANPRKQWLRLDTQIVKG